MRAALVVNAYAVGNWGDAAIAESTFAALRRRGFERIVVAPVDWRTHADAWRQLGADAVVQPLVGFFDAPRGLGSRPAMLGWTLTRFARHRLGLRGRDPAMAAYREASLVVSVGGGYLGGRRAGPNLIKLVNIRAANAAGRRAVVAPVTVNPSSGAVPRLLRWGLRDATVLARDAGTVATLARAGIEAAVAPDMAVGSPSLREVAKEAAAGPGTASGLIGWAPRSYRDEHLAWGNPTAAEARTLRGVRHLLATSADRLVLVAHVRARAGDDDRRAVDRVAAGLDPAERDRVEIAPDPDNLRQAVRRYAGLDVLITSRMHAAIFAMAAGTPAVAVGYEPKVAGVMADLGLADRVVPADERLSDEALVDLVERLRTPEERARTIAAFEEAGRRFAVVDRTIREVAADA